MIELTRTRSTHRCPAPILLVVALLLVFPAPVAGSNAGPVPPPALLALAEALADSIDAMTARQIVLVTDTRENGVRIDRGAAGGLRPYSRVTLLPADAPPWTAEIADLEDAATWLKPVDSTGVAPLPGSPVRLRIDLSRLALDRPVLEGGGAYGWTDAWLNRLAERLEARASLAAVVMPAYPDTSEWRESARAAGADAAVHLTLSESSGEWTTTAQVASLRRTRTIGTTRATVRAPGAPGPKAAPAGWPLEPPPGLLAPVSVPVLGGALLDVIGRRWIWSDVLLVLDDRIEAWRVADDSPRSVRTTDLSEIWPPTVPTRWPVAELLPVNTFYAMSGEEARVNYSLCSNRRPRYLTINVEKAVPESMTVLVSDGPLDTLEASLGGCFRELDRVSIPPGWKRDRDIPATAAARLALEEILKDAAGRPLRTESGQLRRKKTAVIFHDDVTGKLWLSSASVAMQIPGRFGGEMDEYRAGLAGPPGFLVTGSAAPGEPDHLEWWIWENGRCERRWAGPAVDGSITAVLSGDRDGDERDDVVCGIVSAREDGFHSTLQIMSSRPRGGVTP